MLDRVIVVDVLVRITAAQTPGQVLPYRLLSDRVLSDGVSPNVVLPDGMSLSGVLPTARTEAGAYVPCVGVAPGGGLVLLRFVQLPVFLLTLGPLARRRADVSPRKHPCFTACNSFSLPFCADMTLNQTSRMMTAHTTRTTSRVTNNQSCC